MKKVVHVGCGGMSRGWLDAATQILDVEIVGLVDVVEEAARKRAAEYHLNEVVIGTTLAEVLARTSADIVFDCTIPEAHSSVTLEALAHGCHVLGEKPLAASMEEARTMVTAARHAGKLFAVIQNRRYDPNIRRFARFLRTDVVGTITTINSDFYTAPHFGGFRDHMQHVLLLDMAIHTFDAARLLAQADPIAVYCKEWNPSNSWYDHDASAIAFFEMSNGIVYTYRGSWCADGLPTSWEADWRVIGRRGSAHWDGGSGMQAQVIDTLGGFISPCRDVDIPAYNATDAIDGHAGQIREFVQCVQHGTVPETVCTDNIKSLAMVFGAIESAETGKRVKIEVG